MTDVIGDGADLDDDLALVVGCGGDFFCDTGEGNGRAVGLGLEETLEDDLVEGRVCSAGKETVELGGRLARVLVI